MKSNLNNLAKLKGQYPNQHIPYQQLLGTQEWNVKRDAIVRRDKDVCTKCGTESTQLAWNSGKAFNILSYTFGPGPNDYQAMEVDKPIVLHVHHLYYVLSKYPWEYEDRALVTLCNNCHLEIHKVEIIPVYEIKEGERMKIPASTCSRCHGAGYFPQYNHVEAGVCFQCRGERYTNLTL